MSRNYKNTHDISSWRLEKEFEVQGEVRWEWMKRWKRIPGVPGYNMPGEKSYGVSSALLNFSHCAYVLVNMYCQWRGKCFSWGRRDYYKSITQRVGVARKVTKLTILKWIKVLEDETIFQNVNNFAPRIIFQGKILKLKIYYKKF